MAHRPTLADAPVARPPCTPCGLYRGIFGESAIWSPHDRGIWWVDMHGHSIVLTGEDGSSRLWKTPGPALPNPRAIVLRERGGILCALNDTLASFSPASGQFDLLPLDLTLPPGHFFNDACVDPAGRLGIGTMAPGLGNDGLATIYQISPDLAPRILIDGLNTTNGLAFSADGLTLYYSDSFQGVRKVWRADYDPHTGSMGEPQLFIDFDGLPGRPDGATVDNAGGYWIVGMGSPYIHRFTYDGSLAMTIELPLDTPTRPTFGGAGLVKLFITTGGLKNGEIDDGLRGGILEIGSGFSGLPAIRCKL